MCARARHGVGVNRNGRFDSQFPIEDIGAFVITLATRLARMFPTHFHTRNARISILAWSTRVGNILPRSRHVVR